MSLSAFRLAVRSAIRGLWTGVWTAEEFDAGMRTAIERQFWFAVQEGIKGCDMVLADLEPDEKKFVYDAIYESESRLGEFADAIELEQLYGGSLQKMLARGELWINRYNQLVSMARTMICSDQKLQWVLGATERHCRTCARLNGVVKRASFWKRMDLHPQGAPNPKLECNGWLCDCRLHPTKKRCTPGPLPNLP